MKTYIDKKFLRLNLDTYLGGFIFFQRIFRDKTFLHWQKICVDRGVGTFYEGLYSI
jgi:hypothetical protein